VTFEGIVVHLSSGSSSPKLYLGLLFPEDKGNIILRNVGDYSPSNIYARETVKEVYSLTGLPGRRH
jgi:hypothetical protein